MRRKTKNTNKLAARKRGGAVDTSDERLANLERRIQYIEGRLTSWGILSPIEFEQKKKKSGPAQRIPDEFLFEYRNGLALWLERVWPELAPELWKAKAEEETRAVLEQFANPLQTRRDYETRLIDNTPALLEFLGSDRFTRKPPTQTMITAMTASDWNERAWKAAARFPTRQIANAMLCRLESEQNYRLRSSQGRSDRRSGHPERHKRHSNGQMPP